MEKKKSEFAIKISVDITELNEAIEKMEQLIALREKAQQALEVVQHISTACTAQVNTSGNDCKERRPVGWKRE